jgi:CheY-like chemotaxis protein
MTGQFRQAVFGRLGGYEDVNDADRLGRDPAMRWIVGGKDVEGQAASTSQMGRFETELLATDANVEVLADMNGAWIDRVHDRRPPKMIILELKNDRFDLVIIDIGLPDGSGLDLLELVKDDGQRLTPVIIFSGQEIGKDVSRKVEAVLVKSRTSNEKLVETIKSLIPART